MYEINNTRRGDSKSLFYPRSLEVTYSNLWRGHLTETIPHQIQRIARHSIFMFIYLYTINSFMYVQPQEIIEFLKTYSIRVHVFNPYHIDSWEFWKIKLPANVCQKSRKSVLLAFGCCSSGKTKVFIGVCDLEQKWISPKRSHMLLPGFFSKSVWLL